MDHNNKKLSRFISAMLDDARQESFNITQEVSSRRSAYMENAENEILAEVYNYIRTEVTKAKNYSGRMISKRILENKRTLFNERTRITDDIMGQVQNRVFLFASSPEYIDALVEMITQATTHLNTNDVVIFLRKEDMQHVNAIKSRIPLNSCPAGFEVGNIKLGGILAESRSQRMHLDLSYDSSFDAAKNKFAELTK